LKNKKNKVCQVHEYNLDFIDIGWGGWVMSPKSYPMNFCAGECPNPMPDHMNTTNNAVFQQLYHQMGKHAKNGIPPPCCIPTELEPLTILYATDRKSLSDTELLQFQKQNGGNKYVPRDDEVVLLKVYNDMAVKSCGCR
jgi:hypothetical protein